MLAGENKPFRPLTSASPRLLFDFLPALMSPKDGEKTHTERRRASFFDCRKVFISDEGEPKSFLRDPRNVG